MIWTPSEKPSATGVWLVRFMADSPDLSGRMRMFIHRGPISVDHTTPLDLSMKPEQLKSARADARTKRPCLHQSL